MEETLTFQDAQRHRVSAILSQPEHPTSTVVVLCHGFLSSKNSTTNKTLTRMLNERGVATCRFDFFGHGESEGLLEDITISLAVGQAKAAVALVRSRGFKRIGLVGSSFGGLVSILTAAQQPGIDCLALKCPVVDFAEELCLEFGAEEMARWQTTDTIPNLMGGAGRIRLKYKMYEDSLQQIAYDPAEHITTPTLIVQGECDELVPLRQSRRLFDVLRGPKRFDLLPGADHQFTRGEDFRTMTTAITEWMTKYLGT